MYIHKALLPDLLGRVVVGQECPSSLPSLVRSLYLVDHFLPLRFEVRNSLWQRISPLLRVWYACGGGAIHEELPGVMLAWREDTVFFALPPDAIIVANRAPSVINLFMIQFYRGLSNGISTVDAPTLLRKSNSVVAWGSRNLQNFPLVLTVLNPELLLNSRDWVLVRMVLRRGSFYQRRHATIFWRWSNFTLHLVDLVVSESLRSYHVWGRQPNVLW